MTVVLVLALLVLILIGPIMLGARMIKANNTGAGAAFLTVIVLAGLNQALETYVVNGTLALAIYGVVGSALVAMILGTGFLRALVLTFVVGLVQLIALMGLIYPLLAS